ncbi:tRNA 2-thiouridine(34) synthase MnmA [Candidatus Dojkabacteria bacterium]|nr:tRNA 2-thiouridine(34) synthase MnmA [Candidatus Dojkabacteria bacterium]
MKKKVLIGISGGVDSAVSAFLLKEAGFEVHGIYLKLFDQVNSNRSRKSSQAVADFLDIEWTELDFRKKFSTKIIDHFTQAYLNGLTPNPCVRCNKFIKSALFWDFAKKLGSDFIATGHYAKTNNGKLFRGIDRKKDQSYFLYRLTSHQLQHTMFPIGDMTKKSVRKFAHEHDIPILNIKESNEVCFMQEVSMRNYLEDRLGTRTGEIIDINTEEKVGKHDGIWFFTIGQRRGIGIGGASKPYYVIKKDSAQNILYVTSDKSDLGTKTVKIADLRFNAEPASEASLNSLELSGAIRYGMKPVPITQIKIDKQGNSATISFESEVLAPAAGQSLVIYSDEQCLGGGIIYQNADYAQQNGGAKTKS